jgi:glyoxylase-like metal-dependent hydrolase (beta-lactamase superfamily II)
MRVQHFFDEPTATLSYVVWDEETRSAVLIDSLLDFDAKSGRTRTRSCQAVARFLDERRLSLPLVLDTHAHADHLTGMPFFRERYGARTAIGAEIRQVQAIFRRIFNLGDGFRVDGSQFDILLREGDALEAGPFRVECFHTPGHTPACMSFRIEDALFVGDCLFMPDYGTARCDFPGGSADALYDSIQRLYSLPETTRIFTCHDYRPGGRPLRFQSTVGEQKRANIQLSERTTRAAFIELRKTRDAVLEMPALILPSIQVNIRAGRFPEPESNGVSYLKIPLNGI